MTVEAYWDLSGDNDIYVCTTDFSACPGAGYTGNSNDELGAADVPVSPNTSYFVIFSPWAANAGNNNIQIKVIVK